MVKREGTNYEKEIGLKWQKQQILKVKSHVGLAYYLRFDTRVTTHFLNKTNGHHDLPRIIIILTLYPSHYTYRNSALERIRKMTQ